MIKLTEQEGTQLYDFLKQLKKNNWILDIRKDGQAFSDIFDWHLKITGLVSAYDGFDSEHQLCYMTRDLCNYFKKDIPVIQTKKCSVCRRVKPIEEFFGKKNCRLCRKKKRVYNKKPIKKKS